MKWFNSDHTIHNIEYKQEFKDFLKKHRLKLKDDTNSDYITWAIYSLWQEIQELKK